MRRGPFRTVCGVTVAEPVGTTGGADHFFGFDPFSGCDFPFALARLAPADFVPAFFTGGDGLEPAPPAARVSSAEAVFPLSPAPSPGSSTSMTSRNRLSGRASTETMEV